MKVLAYTSPALGHLYPLVPTLLELRARGHEVALRTLAAEVPRMQVLGLQATPMDSRVEARESDDWRAKSQLAQLQRALNAFVDRAEHEVPDLRQAIASEGGDVLLVDVNSWGAQTAAETSHLPWAVFAPYPLPIPSRDAPPFGLGLKPMHGPIGRLRDSALLRLSVMGWNKVLPRLNGVRAEAGAPPLSSALDIFGRSPLTLAYTAEPFEYPRRDWPPSVRLVGPSSWEPRADAPRWVEELRGPVILVTSSTEYQDDDRLLQVALDALSGEALTVVATAPAGPPPGLRVPANARLERFVPHGALLGKAVCVVCHGGMGITQKALAAGVPVCAVPFGRDQPEVARRIEVAGAGTRLPASRLTTSNLLRAVRQAMTKREGATRMAAAFRASGGPMAAASAVEALMRTSANTEMPAENPAGRSDR